MEIFRTCQPLKTNIIMMDASCQRDTKVFKIQSTIFIDI